MQRLEKIVAVGTLLATTVFRGQQLPERSNETTIKVYPSGDVKIIEPYDTEHTLSPDYSLYKALHYVVATQYEPLLAACQNGTPPHENGFIHLHRMAEHLMPKHQPTGFLKGKELYFKHRNSI